MGRDASYQVLFNPAVYEKKQFKGIQYIACYDLLVLRREMQECFKPIKVKIHVSINEKSFEHFLDGLYVPRGEIIFTNRRENGAGMFYTKFSHIPSSLS